MESALARLRSDVSHQTGLFDKKSMCMPCEVSSSISCVHLQNTKIKTTFGTHDQSYLFIMNLKTLAMKMASIDEKSHIVI